jgi:opacity protein-like surface antigen
MKFLKIALTTAAIAGFASTASAQDSGFYTNIGVDAYEFEAYAIGVKGGYEVNDYFAIEGQGALGVIDEKETFQGTEFKAGVDYAIGAFGVLKLPVSDSVDVFARAGYHLTEVQASGGGVSASGSFDGFALGAGLQYMFSGANGIRAEYTYLDLPDDITDNGNVFSVSYVRKF